MTPPNGANDLWLIVGLAGRDDAFAGQRLVLGMTPVEVRRSILVPRLANHERVDGALETTYSGGIDA